MLTHACRDDRIHVITLDDVLARDVRERLLAHPPTRHYEVVAPKARGIREAVAEIETMARDTVGSRLIILDVRSSTLPRLRHAYNKVLGYNRRDLNDLCHTILIADGPAALFGSGRAADVFAPLLADHRRDYHAAAFFYDPLLHHEGPMRRPLGFQGEPGFPASLPQRFAAGFWKGDWALSAVRQYFRAAAIAKDMREQVMARRLALLAGLLGKWAAEEFPDNQDLPDAWLCKEGAGIAGETLRLHVYPFFLETWVSDLMLKTRQPVARGTRP